MGIPLRILMIEDNIYDAEYILRIIERHGYETVSIRVDDEAGLCAALEADTWDIITSDHSMPCFSAPAALQTIKSSGVQVPVLIVSGEIDIDLAVSLMKEGAADYIRKDDLQRLPFCIDRELERKALREEQEATAAALAEMEKRFRFIVNHSQDILVLINEAGEQFYISPSVEAYTGFKPEELMGQFAAVIHPDDLPVVLAAWTEVIKESGNVGRAEYRHRHLVHGWIWFEAIAYNMTSDPDIKAVVVNVRDITDRRKAEEDLRETRDFLDKLILNASAPILVWDHSGRITRSNRAFEQLSGYGADELTGRSIFSLFPGENTCDAIDQAARGISWKYRALPIVHRSGRLHHVLWNSANIMNQAGTAVQATIVQGLDMTDQMLVEASLKASERMNRLFSEISQAFLLEKQSRVFSLILDLVMEVMASRLGIFGFLNEKGDLVTPSMTREIWEECDMPHKTIIFPRDSWGDSIWGDVLREGTPRMANHLMKTPPGHILIDRALSVPIMHSRDVIGLITVANKETDYSAADLENLTAICNFIAPLLLAVLEQQRLNRDLSTSKERYRRIFEDSPAGIMHFDETGEVIECNRAFAELVGLDQNDIRGFNLLRLPDPEMNRLLLNTLEGIPGEFAGIYHTYFSDRDINVKILYRPNSVTGGGTIFMEKRSPAHEPPDQGSGDKGTSGRDNSSLNEENQS